MNNKNNITTTNVCGNKSNESIDNKDNNNSNNNL